MQLTEQRREYAEAWRADTLTPELVQKTWQAFWNALSPNVKLAVPECDRSREELAALKKTKPPRMVIYMPDEVMTEQGKGLLADMFPQESTQLLSRGIISSDEGGWVDVEMSVRPPHLGKKAREVEAEFRTMRREGMRIQTYLVASKFRQLLDGERFDMFSKHTDTMLLGSLTAESKPVSRKPLEVTRTNKEVLVIRPGNWTQKSACVGFRSEGRKRAA